MAKGTITKEAAISVTEFDLGRLRNLIDIARYDGADWHGPYLNRLEAELERAEVVDPKDIPKDVVTMRINSSPQRPR